ncbi:MAG: hypothetical protein NZ561_02465 [Phycisphaerae bacterium]|nr:hypothetical protein [Phycisphaerae bacterium]MDW8261721.1 hypothetical protein [Phycisphaerales bacterium]
MVASPPLATRLAERNFRRNLAALAQVQPRDGSDAWQGGVFGHPDCPLPGDWELVFARDGSISVVDQAGRFHRGCSVPLLAAREQLGAMKVSGACGCLLDPMHAAALRVVLDRLRPEQSVIAILPNLDDAMLLLHCDDFCAEIAAGRCWIVAGPDWLQQLRSCLLGQAGLAIPTQFIRTCDADVASTDVLIARSQALFGEIAAWRSRRVGEIREHSRHPSNELRRICLVGGQRFRLWNDWAFMLAGVMSRAGLEVRVFDTDNPRNATPLALAEAVAGCDAILSSGVLRADHPGPVTAQIPWITWLTQPREIPPFDQGADAAIVVDRSLFDSLRSAGWPEDRVMVADWPDASEWLLDDASGSPVTPPAIDAPAALLADIPPLNPPSDLEELSSHRLLWEFLAHQMAHDPFAAFDRAERLIDDGMQRYQIAGAGLDRRRFLEELIVPAYAVAVARILCRSGVHLALYGRGWDQFEELLRFWRGPVHNRREFRSAVAVARCLVHAVPSSRPHPIDATGRPVARYREGKVAGLLRAVRSPTQTIKPRQSLVGAVQRLWQGITARR